MQDKLFQPIQIETPPAPVTDLMAACPGAFGSVAAAQRFVQLIWFPPDRGWRYQLNGKSGNTFVLNLLFELEYGQPFSCHVAQAEGSGKKPLQYMWYVKKSKAPARVAGSASIIRTIVAAMSAAWLVESFSSNVDSSAAWSHMYSENIDDEPPPR